MDLLRGVPSSPQVLSPSPAPSSPQQQQQQQQHLHQTSAQDFGAAPVDPFQQNLFNSPTQNSWPSSSPGVRLFSFIILKDSAFPIEYFL